MVVILIMFVLCALESAFCFIMRQSYQRKSKQHNMEQCGSPSVSEQVSATLKRKLFNYLMSLANDITFLFVKIVGYIPVHFIRMFFYKYIFHMSIGKNVVIYYGFEARAPWKITIGDGSVIGDKAIMDARFGITIGQNVNLSTGVWIWTLQHDVNSKEFGVEGQGKKVKIEDRAWISSRTVLLPGCLISEGVVVAAGAVVTKSCNVPFSIWGGYLRKKLEIEIQKSIMFLKESIGDLYRTGDIIG